jgi:hypothetical protein
VKRFVEYYVTNAGELAGQVGYVALDAPQYQEQLRKLGEPAAR